MMDIDFDFLAISTSIENARCRQKQVMLRMIFLPQSSQRKQRLRDLIIHMNRIKNPFLSEFAISNREQPGQTGTPKVD